MVAGDGALTHAPTCRGSTGGSVPAGDNAGRVRKAGKLRRRWWRTPGRFVSCPNRIVLFLFCLVNTYVFFLSRCPDDMEAHARGVP